MGILFAGTPDFAVPPLEALLQAGLPVVGVLTQPDRPAGRGRRVRPSPVKRLATARGLPVYQPRTLKDPEAQAEIRRLRPDLMIVAAYGLLLPPEVLSLPALGGVNIHASLLPRWRGAAPIQRALLAGDQETGITIMQMDEGLDTGQILLQHRCPMAPGDTAGALHDRLAALGARAILDYLDRVAAGDLAPQAQDEGAATYAAKIDKAEAEMDWGQSSVALERAVRAFNPWPVAHTRFEGRPLRIWEARALPGGRQGPPGTVLGQSAEGVDVATGDGVLRLVTVQRPGGRAMPATAFVNAHDMSHARLG